MKVLSCPQGSEAWFAARRGLPTCSRFDSILTPKTAKPAAAQHSLINSLISESVCPPEEAFVRPTTAEMEYGLKLEAEARCCYELEHAVGKISEAGFVLHESGMFGGSPDALVGEDGGVEIKCPNPATHIGYVRDGGLPSEYRCQVHGYMIVTGRKWWDFWSYARHFEPFLLRVTRDDFTAALEAELHAFCGRYNEARAKFSLPPVGIKAAA